MAKKSRKQLARSGNDNAGCMWGLINMFDFRRGPSNLKLLSDKKHGIVGHPGTKSSRSKSDLPRNFEDSQEVDGCIHDSTKKVTLGTTRVKTLMEEEISRTHSSKKIPSDEVERIQSELGLQVHLGKKYKQTTNRFEMVSELVNDSRTPASLESHQSSCTDRSSLNFDLAEFMIKFYSENHQHRKKHLDCIKLNHLDGSDPQLLEKQFLFQKALDAAEVFLNQNFDASKHLNGASQTREFLEAIETLNSNKELLLSLLEDPNSLILRHIQDRQLESGKHLETSELLEEIGSSKQCEEPIDRNLKKESGYRFFKKKDKSERVKPAKVSSSSDALNKIVVLRPSQASVDTDSMAVSPSFSSQSFHSLKCQDDEERVASHFSLKEIKRRLRHAIGESRKEQHVISMDGILHRIPYGSKYFCDSGQSSVSKKSKKAETKDCNQRMKARDKSVTVDNHKRMNTAAGAEPLKEKSFYKEAKKHLIDMLGTGDGGDILPTKPFSKSLGRLLSLPEYNLSSPRFSPTREKGFGLKQESAIVPSGPSVMDFMTTTCIDENQDSKAEVVDANPKLVDTQIDGICVRYDLNKTGNSDMLELAEIISWEEFAQLNEVSGSDSNKSCITSERFKEEESGLLDEKSPATIQPSFLLVENRKDDESIFVKPERPSPISVLEPSEDPSSPQDDAEFPTCPRSIHFDITSDCETNMRNGENDKASDISCLSCDDILRKWVSSDRAIDPSLFDEIGIPLSDDLELLSDLISEVVMDIQERLFSSSPWVSLVQCKVRPVPIGANLIKQVRREIGRRLHCQSPCTLDEIIGKDMERRTWMEHQSEMESVVVETGDAILEALVEETAVEIKV